MPIEDITLRQKQGQLFVPKLSVVLDPNNKLYKLRSLIDWPTLREWAQTNIAVKQFGRNRRDYRLLLGVTMLQAMYNLSDARAEEELAENAYWQYFCGFEHLEKNVGVSETAIRRFRALLGEAGCNEILKELIRIGNKTGLIKKKDLESVIIDSTVQSKNIKYPHDAYLLEKARSQIVRLCHNLGIKLNETYAKRFKRDIVKLWSYKQDSRAKKRHKIMKHLKILLGRLIRICERRIENQCIMLSQLSQEVLQKVKNIHAQSVLNSKKKAEYKKDNKILYSFHAPEVECIGKGKLNKPYEFGNKVSVAVSGHNNFILTAKSFHNAPYDGHTLVQTIESVKQLTSTEINKVFVDRGYQGNNYSQKKKIYSPVSKKQLSLDDKKMLKRRNAIEPIIGHLKNHGRMARNYLKGVIGDIINPLISAIGLNLRAISNYLLKAT